MFTNHQIKSETLGDFLRKNRQNTGWQLIDVSRRIKISETYLGAIEENNYYQLPSPTYVKGFLKSYAEFLGLDANEIIERYQKENQFFEIREKIFDQRRLRQAPLPGLGRFIKKGHRMINFDLRKIGGFAILLAFLIYFAWTVGQAILPPKIIVFSPPNNFETKEKTVLVKGQIKGQAAVKINGQAVSKFEKGFFEQTLDLAPGINLIKVSAQKKHSPEAVILRRVILKN